jgi:hypothetical protein
VDGKTIVSKTPEQPKTATEKQKMHRQRFQEAILYAKMATDDPETKSVYKSVSKRPFNLAVADFFHAPDIHAVDLSTYTGTVGEEIRITVSDDFAVKSVHVTIRNTDGTLVEEGEAVRRAGNLWIYTATQNNENLSGDKILITASDLPGNITEEEKTL